MNLKKIVILVMVLMLLNTAIIFSPATQQNQITENNSQPRISVQTMTLYPTDDAFSSTQFGEFGFPHRKTGHSQTINVGEFNNIFSLGYTSWGYIQFNLSEIPVPLSKVTLARLQLYKHVTAGWPVKNASALVRINLHCLSSGFDEDLIRANDHLNYEKDPVSYCWMTRGTEDNGWKEWDVTECIQNWKGLWGWALVMSPYHRPVDSTCNIINFYSNDWPPQKPELVITYEGEGPATELTVDITQPEDMWIYLNGIKYMRITPWLINLISSLISWFNVPPDFNGPIAVLLGGYLLIKVNADAPSGIDRVEFSMISLFSPDQQSTDISPPYEWFWNDMHPGINVYGLNVKAFDNTGDSAEDNMLLFRFW